MTECPQYFSSFISYHSYPGVFNSVTLKHSTFHNFNTSYYSIGAQSVLHLFLLLFTLQWETGLKAPFPSLTTLYNFKSDFHNSLSHIFLCPSLTLDSVIPNLDATEKKFHI